MFLKRNDGYVLMIAFVVVMLAACSQESEPVNEVNPDMIFDTEEHEDDLRIHFFDLVAPDRYEKTGESIFIQTPQGKTILIDAGVPDVGPLVADYLTDLDVDKIDLAMPSHPHIDHIGGYLTVFEEKEIEKVVEINLPHEDSGVYQDYSQMIEDQEIEVEHAEDGDVIELEKDLTMEILNPMEGLSPDTYSFATLTAGIINDVSMVIKLTHKDNTFLFTGDIYRGVESTIVDKYEEKIDVDVVVSPHHGLGTSNSDKFVEATDPDITLIPTNMLFDLNIIDKYEQQGSDVYVSKFDGNVLLTSNGKKIDVYREKEKEPEEDAPDEVDNSGEVNDDE